MSGTELTCFKAYDIRGKLGDELNEEIAYAIGRAFAIVLQPKTVVIGGDIRLTSKAFKLAVACGLQSEGVDVIDLGMTGTEEVYFATSFLKADGGIEITASHNPINYNGMKFVQENSKPVSGDTGLNDIKAVAEEILSLNYRSGINQSFEDNLQIKSSFGDYVRLNSDQPKREVEFVDLKTEYAKCMLSFIDLAKIKPLKLVVNAGNGAAGPALDAIEKELKANDVKIEFIKINHTPDGNFPNGIPNPLLPECRADTRNAVLKHNADMGIAWDGDFDRCFLFDECGEFIEGYYIVGLLAEAFLQQHQDSETSSESISSKLPELVSGSKQPKEKIIHDPRLTWNTIDIVESNNGIAVMSKTGHAFIKERMREENAIYGGEMSAHHYFRDFAYCDSGMIPWLLVVQLLSVTGKSLSELVAKRITDFPSSGEINLILKDPIQAIQQVLHHYEKKAVSVDKTDGISLEFIDEAGEWRFNLRSSNTEPIVRLNVETKGNVELLKCQTKELLSILNY
ncbi:phosphomannomutase CpsG [Thalassotalea nanhaiensis]|uniref:phosphomannomutase n=1 Tax=Thalassotalea nanhaiensis TaxID=3065648 RepID=A0ABY9TPK3_9GAMM|nr:phosphomannomutase CpsG [Colwelliaceae bacterium SQ345]